MPNLNRTAVPGHDEVPLSGRVVRPALVAGIHVSLWLIQKGVDGEASPPTTTEKDVSASVSLPLR
jgi:hypothetical protein